MLLSRARVLIDRMAYALQHASERSRTARREAFALVTLCTGALTVLSLISFRHDDGSLNQAHGIYNGTTHNWVGPVGAFWADLCLQMLGLLSWGLAASLLYVGARLMVGHRPQPKRRQVLTITVFAISAGTLIELLMLGRRLHYPLGGVFGAILARFLREHFAPVGASVIAMTGAVLAFTFGVTGTLSSLSRRLGRTVNAEADVLRQRAQAQLVRRGLWPQGREPASLLGGHEASSTELAGAAVEHEALAEPPSWLLRRDHAASQAPAGAHAAVDSHAPTGAAWASSAQMAEQLASEHAQDNGPQAPLQEPVYQGVVDVEAAPLSMSLGEFAEPAAQVDALQDEAPALAQKQAVLAASAAPENADVAAAALDAAEEPGSAALPVDAVLAAAGPSDRVAEAEAEAEAEAQSQAMPVDVAPLAFGPLDPLDLATQPGRDQWLSDPADAYAAAAPAPAADTDGSSWTPSALSATSAAQAGSTPDHAAPLADFAALDDDMAAQGAAMAETEQPALAADAQRYASDVQGRHHGGMRLSAAVADELTYERDEEDLPMADAAQDVADEAPADDLAQLAAGAHVPDDLADLDELIVAEDIDAQDYEASDDAADGAAAAEPDFLSPAPYALPPASLLHYQATAKTPIDPVTLQHNAERLEATLRTYGIDGHVREIRPGPVVTMYEYVPGPGIKLARIASLADDLAMSMEALRVRIVAPIPGKGAVGIEIPNEHRDMVHLKEIVEHASFTDARAPLTCALGKDIEGLPVAKNLAHMPHLLVAGATGAGKSVSVNAMIMSLLFKATPAQVRMIMVDPKMLELSVYEGIPHLMLPVVTDPKKAALALRWAVEEMERRYELLSEVGVRSIDAFNSKVRVAQERGDPLTVSGHDPDMPRQACDTLPYILVVVDELADLMMVASREVETSIMRLAQMARAAGIHLILATQRPSVDVITGVIKANFPSRIAFQVASKHDSRTIIDANGAEHLLGRGDMLLMSNAAGGLQRIHGAYVSEDDIERTVAFVKAQAQPTYDESILAPRAEESADGDDAEVDEMYDQAVAVVAETQQASVSMIQRRMRIGYNRAARMVERMEREGVVGPGDGAKPREVFVSAQS